MNPAENALADHIAERLRTAVIADGQLVAEYRSARFERLVARMYPTAQRPALRAIADVLVWTFLVDDFLDPHRPEGAPERVDRVRAHIDSALDHRATARPADEYLTGWLAAALDGIDAPDHAWNRHFTDHLREFATALCAESRVHASGVVPTVSEFVATRHDTSAWNVCVDLIELQPGATLPERLRRSALAQAMYTRAGEIVCAINDIISLPKEAAHGERHNLILLIQHHEACSLPEAVDRVRAYMTERTAAYLQAKAAFLDHARGHGPQVRTASERFTTGLEHLIRGSYDWMIDTGRYKLSTTT
ncbi:MAG TPA: hypothetical protein VFN97_10795 [Actinospica sp.]|nr:hypothetical protein [Actinospica sp.]